MINLCENKTYKIEKILECDVQEITLLREKLNDIHVEKVDGIFKDNIFNSLLQNTKNDMNNIYKIYNEKIYGYIKYKCQIINETCDQFARKVCYVSELYINEEFQGNGLGKEVLEFIIEKAKNEGYDTVELDVYSFNDSAVSFYERNGFKEYKKTMAYKI